MQRLQETSRGGLRSCFSAQWGVGACTAHRQQRLWLLCGDGNLQAYDLDGSKAALAQVHISLPDGETLVVTAPGVKVAPDEAAYMALGTRSGSVLLLERLPDRALCTCSSESWSVSVEVTRAHAAPLDAAAWSLDGRVLATAAADGSVIIWQVFHLCSDNTASCSPSPFSGLQA